MSTPRLRLHQRLKDDHNPMKHIARASGASGVDRPPYYRRIELLEKARYSLEFREA
jgi:hypothetical protein